VVLGVASADITAHFFFSFFFLLFFMGKNRFFVHSHAQKNELVMSVVRIVMTFLSSLLFAIGVHNVEDNSALDFCRFNFTGYHFSIAMGFLASFCMIALLVLLIRRFRDYLAAQADGRSAAPTGVSRCLPLTDCPVVVGYSAPRPLSPPCKCVY
jgi:uncharacterized membrane protein